MNGIMGVEHMDQIWMALVKDAGRKVNGTLSIEQDLTRIRLVKDAAGMKRCYL